MSDCSILFADFGDYIFRVPVESIRYRMVTVFGSIPKGPAFVSHLTSSALNGTVLAPPQSTLTVAQDPHGSGKTYGLTRMMIHTDCEEHRRYAHYRTFIVVTKPHSAKEVVYREFMKHLNDSGFEVRQNVSAGNKYVVTFTRPDGADILCIFGTADSLMWGLAENKERGTDPFVNLVQTIHRHGPTKLQGPKGRMRYAAEQPQINAKTLLITDEATMLPEAYAGAFAKLMHMCHVDVHLAGDVQQSTYYEDNLLTKVVREYNEVKACPGSHYLPSFPGSEVIIRPGNQVRRFNQHLVDFRNTIMKGFHDNPTHNLDIAVPVAAIDVSHERGEYSIHGLEYAGPRADPETIQDAVDEIMVHIEGDVEKYDLLPNDFLIVTPFVKNNPLMDQLRTLIEEFWVQKFNDSVYVDRIRHLPDFNETLRLAEGGQEAPNEREKSEDLPWLCVLHRSEEGKPIDTNESKYGTRIVSIHASQGDGRRFVYLVGMTQMALSRFSGGKINLKYESLMNVAVSRMKEVMRVFLQKTHDDVWDRFVPLMPPELRHDSAVPPKINVAVRFKISDCSIDTSLDGMQELFEETKVHFDAESPVEGQPPPTLVDYAHHEVRMATANSIFHAKVLVHQVANGWLKHSEQLYNVFKKVSRFPITSLNSKEYYQELNKKRREEKSCIPVLYYNTGATLYNAVHSRIMKLLQEVQGDIKSWLKGDGLRMDAFDKPEKAVLMQYAVGYVTSGAYGEVKMDTVYDVVNCYMHTAEETGKLSRHYDELKNVDKMFSQVIDRGGNQDDWSWKIERHITLGKANGGTLPYFDIKGCIHHLCITATLAMPVIIVPDVDEMSMAQHCATAIQQTLLCLQSEHEKFENSNWTPTWEYVKDKEILVCFVPVKASRPVFVDVTAVVRGSISLIADWVSQQIQRETEADHPQLLKIAERDFETALEEVQAAKKKNKCLDYMLSAFEEASDKSGFEDLDRELRAKLKNHIRKFKAQLEKRDAGMKLK